MTATPPTTDRAEAPVESDARASTTAAGAAAAYADAPPPRPLVLLAGAVVVVATAMVFVGGWRTGVSWDETYHVMRGQNFLDHGWFLLDWDFDGSGRVASWADERFVYGPVTMLLLHGLGILTGVEAPGTISSTATAFSVRHLGVGVIGMVGVLAAAGLGRVVLGGWRWALVTAGLLMAVPTWTGHSMFNVKDISTATGYTLVTLGLVLVARSADRRRWWVVGGSALVVAGIVLAVGTRPGIAPGLVLAGGVTLLSRDRVRWVAALVALAVSAALLYLAYPSAFVTPVTALVEGALSSSRYDDTVGHWWYLPVFLLIELPTLHLVLGGLGTAVCLRRLWRHRDDPDPTRLAVVLVLLQALALPVLAVVRESNLYTGLRQLLFAAPAMAVLATVAVAALLPLARRSARTWLRRGAPVVAGLALLWPTAAQAQLFPYNYAYLTVPANAVAPQLPGINPEIEIESDYWRTSVRELAPSVPEGGFVMCSTIADDGVRMRYSRESHDDCATDPVGPLAPYADLRSGTWDDAPTRFLAVETGSMQVGDNCTVLQRVTRWLWWRPVTMGYVASCDLVLEPYAGPVVFDGDGAGFAATLGGWTSRPDLPGIGLAEDAGSAAIGYALPDDLRDAALAVRGSAEGVTGLDLQVNGVPVSVSTTADGDFSAVVPENVAQAYDAGRLVLTFGDADGDLRLTSLRIDPEDRAEEVP